MSSATSKQPTPVWLFDLDNTLHNASASLFPAIDGLMTQSIAQLLTIPVAHANQLRHDYWQRYGATLIGLIKHHGICPEQFLHLSHDFDVVDQVLCESGLKRHLQRLPGRKVLCTNAPANYAHRVLNELGIQPLFERVFSIEDMFLQQRCHPKPSRRLMQQLLSRLNVPAHHVIFVDDTLRNLKVAHQLGIRTVHFAHPGTPFSSTYAGRAPYIDLRVSSIKELGQRYPFG
ncbi:pyrimidine 5'-nucleotidase [Paenalcaligenes hominis]|uniref:pyrimidine 5'-nucleotidase n=1 Tax=Paenalcaligenes hominis TaxID=643674 RepID=UPI0035260625